MQRIAFSTLVTTVLAFNSAAADPLDLRGPGLPPPPGIGSIFAAPAPAVEPATPRRASVDGPNMGGGFLEMLFRGPGGEPPVPRTYEPQQAPAPASAPRFNQPFAYGGDREPDLLDSNAPAQPSRGPVNPRFDRQEVSYDGREPAGTVIINTRERLLYLVQGNGKAVRYGIGVGRPGFTWAGAHSISQMREWPSWRPPSEMLRRQPHLPRFMPGGSNNPLGARAMYLGSTLYRIHGSNEPWTIVTQVSSGCIRMRNEDVIDLYGRVHVGTRVVVL